MSDEPAARQEAPDRSVLRAGPPTDGTDRELALDLTREAVRLVARTAEHEWIELGSVPLAASDFRAALDALRQRAGADGAPPVTIWLPPDQILLRRYVLKRGDRAAEALRRLAEDTGHRARELTVALSPAADGELVTVLGASRQTVAEAADYARRWGFRAERVSTRVEAERFGTHGPAFDLPGPAPRGMPVGARRALAAAAAALAIGVASWGAYGLLPAADSPSLAVVSAPEAAAPLTEERVAAAPPTRPDRQVARSPDPDRSAPAEPPGRETARAGGAPAAETALPPLLAAAAPDASARLGRASAAPASREPASRPQSAGPEAGADVGVLLTGIDRIQAVDAADEQSGRENPAEDEILLAASDAAPVVVPGRPLPRPSAPDATEAVSEPDPHAEEEAVEAEGSDVPVPAASMSESRLAAVRAPTPPARPERPRRAAPAAAFRIEAPPPPVGSAAAQGSLSLDATSLIGVIDANTGREALLRTPSGDFLKVHRGDEVAGWRVNAIGQDAMRLTRGGESRTLLLVTR